MWDGIIPYFYINRNDAKRFCMPFATGIHKFRWFPSDSCSFVLFNVSYYNFQWYFMKIVKVFFIQVFFRCLSLLKLVVNIFFIQILAYTASVQRVYLKRQLNEILPVTDRLHSCVFLQFWWQSDLLYLVVYIYTETEYLWYNTVKNETLPWATWKRRLEITFSFLTYYSW